MLGFFALKNIFLVILVSNFAFGLHSLPLFKLCLYVLCFLCVTKPCQMHQCINRFVKLKNWRIVNTCNTRMNEDILSFNLHTKSSDNCSTVLILGEKISETFAGIITQVLRIFFARLFVFFTVLLKHVGEFELEMRIVLRELLKFYEHYKFIMGLNLSYGFIRGAKCVNCFQVHNIFINLIFKYFLLTYNKIFF